MFTTDTCLAKTKIPLIPGQIFSFQHIKASFKGCFKNNAIPLLWRKRFISLMTLKHYSNLRKAGFVSHICVREKLCPHNIAAHVPREILALENFKVSSVRERDFQLDDGLRDLFTSICPDGLNTTSRSLQIVVERPRWKAGCYDM